MLLLPRRPSSWLRYSVGVQVTHPWHKEDLGLHLWIPKGLVVPPCSKPSWTGPLFFLLLKVCWHANVTKIDSDRESIGEPSKGSTQ